MNLYRTGGSCGLMLATFNAGVKRVFSPYRGYFFQRYEALMITYSGDVSRRWAAFIGAITAKATGVI